MKAKFTLRLIIVALATVSLIFTLKASNSPVPLTETQKQQIRGGACKSCVAEWVSQADLLDGQTECDHGPETDPDCVGEGDSCFGLDCKENGDPCHPCYNPNCECFKCGNVTGCERLKEVWQAWCGADSNEATADCYPDCNTVSDTSGENERWIPQVVIGGGNCSYEPNIVVSHNCGKSGGDKLACATSDCEPDGDWTTYSGPRQKCDN